MTNNVPAFENVANLEKLPAKGFQIVALPMKIKGGWVRLSGSSRSFRGSEPMPRADNNWRFASKIGP